MNDTIFGKIITGEIPATKVYEDNISLAFMDIHPVSKGHILLIPKEHYIWMQDVPDTILENLFVKAKQLMAAMKDSIGCDYVQLSVIGKDVPHFHIHLIPRYLNDEIQEWKTSMYQEGEMSAFAEKIKSAL